MTYSGTYSPEEFAQMLSEPAFLNTLLVSCAFLLALVVFGIVVTWKVFKKAGQPGWGSLVPVYNVWLMYKISWGKGWILLITAALGIAYPICMSATVLAESNAWVYSILVMLIAVAQLVIQIVTIVKLAHAFGKSGGFACGLFFLSLIFMAILAFGDARYVGSKSRRKKITG